MLNAPDDHRGRCPETADAAMDFVDGVVGAAGRTVDPAIRPILRDYAAGLITAEEYIRRTDEIINRASTTTPENRLRSNGRHGRGTPARSLGRYRTPRTLPSAGRG